jgi:uncharacterized phage protein (TIGR02216 family)
MDHQTPLQWDKLLNIALGKLRLEPEVFWKMTPQEFIIILESYSEDYQPIISQKDLHLLQQQFPD